MFVSQLHVFHKYNEGCEIQSSSPILRRCSKHEWVSRKPFVVHTFVTDLDVPSSSQRTTPYVHQTHVSRHGALRGFLRPVDKSRPLQHQLGTVFTKKQFPLHSTCVHSTSICIVSLCPQLPPHLFFCAILFWIVFLSGKRLTSTDPPDHPHLGPFHLWYSTMNISLFSHT